MSAEKEESAFIAFNKIQSLLNTQEKVQSTPDFDLDYNHRIESIGGIFSDDAFSNQSPSTPLRIVPLGESYAEQSFTSQVPNNSNLNNASNKEFDGSGVDNESLFLKIIAENYLCTGNNMGSTPSKLTDSFIQADIAGKFASIDNNWHFELDRAQRSIRFSSTFKPSNNPNSASKLKKEAELLKLERDTWSLLEILTLSDLLMDLDCSTTEDDLNKSLSSLPITATIPDFINCAYVTDKRIKKGAILKDWVEKSAADLVVDYPSTRSDPFLHTTARILNESSSTKKMDLSDQSHLKMLSIHPDAQITPEAFLLPLDGVDQSDQESLLKAIWQLLRSGNVMQAQELAAAHQNFWLAASLQGLSSHYYKEMPPDIIDEDDLGEHKEDMDVEGPSIKPTVVSQVGNQRQPLWIKSCWNYSNFLSSNKENWCQQTAATTLSNLPSSAAKAKSKKIASLSGMLELSIYASLANNTKVLMQSPLIQTWHDKFWVYLKATHDRDVQRIIHRFRCQKFSHSQFYQGCDPKTISSERELLDLNKAEIGHMSTADCAQIFNKIQTPSHMDSPEIIIILLQMAIIEGKTGISNFIENTVFPYLSASSPKQTVCESILTRLFCLLLIWLKFSSPEPHADLSELVPDALLYLSIEKYTDYLIESKQYNLVAPYVAFLNRPRRIKKYSELLRAMPCAATRQLGEVKEASDGVDSNEIMQLANIYFPMDVIEITRSFLDSPLDNNAPSIESRPLQITQWESSGPEVAAASTSLVVLDSPDNLSFRSASISRTASKPTPRKSGLTPGFKSHDESSTKRHPRHTSIKVYRDQLTFSSSAPITTEDLSRLESLKWLFLDSSLRLEAIRQCNSLVLQFMLESDCTKFLHVQALLADHLPLDSLEVGRKMICLHESEVHESIASDDLDEASASRLESDLWLEKEKFNSQSGLIAFWKAFVASIEASEAFYQSLEEYGSQQSKGIFSPQSIRSSLSGHRSKLLRHASLALDSLFNSLTCRSFDANDCSDIHGFKDVWTHFERSSLSFLSLQTSQILEFFNASSNSPNSIQNLRTAVRNGEDCDRDHMISEIRSGIQEMNALYADFLMIREPEQAEVYSIIKTQLDALVTDEGIELKHLHTDMLSSIRDLLIQCFKLLKDVFAAWRIASKVLFLCINTYLEICASTGAILDEQDLPLEASKFYTKAVKLADLVATEELSFQLYGILHRDHLEKVLDKINANVFHLLKNDPQFNC